MNRKWLSLLLGFIGGVIGCALVFVVRTFSTLEYGTLAEWVSGLSTLTALGFAFWQIQEQKREFEENRTAKVAISVNNQIVLAPFLDGGNLPSEPNLYIWAVNVGMASGSFMFLGFCRKDEFKYIHDLKRNVVFNPNHDMNSDSFKPYTKDDFQNLKPGELTEQVKYSPQDLKKRLNNPSRVYVMYMSATGKIAKREIYLGEDGDDEE